MSFIWRRLIVGLLVPFAWKRWRQRSKQGGSATSGATTTGAPTR
jgi:hypothetical protein